MGIKCIQIEDYPAIKAHLDNYYDYLEKRGDKGDTRYNLRNCAYTDDFFKQKIVWGEISDRTKFSIDIEGKFIPEATTFLMTGKHLLFLLGFLNSKMSEYLFAQIGTTTGVGTVRWKKFTIEQILVPVVSLNVQQLINEAVLEIIDRQNRGLDLNEQINKIDKAMFEAFKLTDEEIDVVRK